MTLIIVGATGTLGRQITRRALDEGHKVRCLVRSPKRAAFLKEWGAELVQADLMRPESLPAALEGGTAVIDTATARPTESIRDLDWHGKVSLIQAVRTAQIKRFIFFSILHAEQYPHVPLMDIKACTEDFLAETDLDYTVLRCGGFFQGLIGQYAIPLLENQTIWVTGETTPVAYIDTQDAARLVLRALVVPETSRQIFPVVGPRSWNAAEIIKLCERMSGRDAKVTQLPLNLLRATRSVARFFEWGGNLSDRLAFAEVLASGKPLSAPMQEVYRILDLDPQTIGTLEDYLREYFGRILKKLKELDYGRPGSRSKAPKKRS